MIYGGPSGTETTYYATPMFERVDTSAGSDFRHYIYADGRPVVVISRTSAGAITTRSLLVDHQGSISSIAADSTGTPYISESFTAFGNRREASTWTGTPTSSERATMDGVTREGYTFQTVLGSMGLNHMNGRVQDAVTGRFLSAAPYVASPSNTQSYNRYSYAVNNPLSRVDPSGFWVFLPYYGDLSGGASAGELPEQQVTGTSESPPQPNGDPSLTGGGGGGGAGTGEGAGGHGGQKSDTISDPIQVLGHVGSGAPAGSFVSTSGLGSGAYAVNNPDGSIFGYVATAPTSAAARAAGILGSTAQKVQSKNPYQEPIPCPTLPNVTFKFGAFADFGVGKLKGSLNLFTFNFPMRGGNNYMTQGGGVGIENARLPGLPGMPLGVGVTRTSTDGGLWQTVSWSATSDAASVSADDGLAFDIGAGIGVSVTNLENLGNIILGCPVN